MSDEVTETRKLVWMVHREVPNGGESYQQFEITEATELFDVFSTLDEQLGTEKVCQYVSDHYALHGTDMCDHGDCGTYYEEVVEPDQLRWRQLAQDWHNVAADELPGHGVGSYALCGAEKCRRAAELLGDRP